MRNRCGLVLCSVAASAAIGLTGAGSVSAATTQHARPNATDACGTECFDASSELLGAGAILNAYIPGDTGVGGRVGQKLMLKFASNSHPNEDLLAGGSVADSQLFTAVMGPADHHGCPIVARPARDRQTAHARQTRRARSAGARPGLLSGRRDPGPYGRSPETRRAEQRNICALTVTEQLLVVAFHY
jgi:hypothetical protein